MSDLTWQETQSKIGLPAAATLQQSIVLAQLEIYRRIERQRNNRQIFHTVFDGEVE